MDILLLPGVNFLKISLTVKINKNLPLSQVFLAFSFLKIQFCIIMNIKTVKISTIPKFQVWKKKKQQNNFIVYFFTT